MTSKIHRATVTQADLDYVGSITVDVDLLEAADLLPGERVDICNCTNGNRLSTYVIPGERGGGEICVNGAAAHLVSAVPTPARSRPTPTSPASRGCVPPASPWPTPAPERSAGRGRRRTRPPRTAPDTAVLR